MLAKIDLISKSDVSHCSNEYRAINFSLLRFLTKDLELSQVLSAFAFSTRLESIMVNFLSINAI